MRILSLIVCSALIASCGSDSNDDSSPPIISEPNQTPKVSFSISDAPADSVTSVNVTLSAILLKSESDDENDDSGLTLTIVDSGGIEATITIDNIEVPAGTYTNLILITSGCPQNQNGSTDFCWVEDGNGRKTLKVPSNLLKLGSLTISEESEQAFTIEFNLRSSMVSTAGGNSYNLKPHGVRIVNDNQIGTLAGTINVNLLTSGEGCSADFAPDTDHGKIVYLYEGEIAAEQIMADEFDPEVATNEIPENAVKPFASTEISYDESTDIYSYAFSQLPIGEYTVAFSCSSVGDDPEKYDSISIPNPAEQMHIVEIEENTGTVADFSEN